MNCAALSYKWAIKGSYFKLRAPFQLVPIVRMVISFIF